MNHRSIKRWDFAKPVKEISLPQDVPSISNRRLIELEYQVQCLMEAHLAPKQPVQVNKITSTCEIYSGPHATQYCMEKPEQAFVKYASARTDETGGKWYTFKPEQNNLGDTYNLTWKSHPNLRDVEVHIGRLKLLNEFYVIDMKKDLETPLLARRGFLATANTIIDYRKAKIKDNPPKNKDRAWHAKIRLIDQGGEEFTKTFQLVPTSRKLFERESPREIIDLDHFYDT
nr:MAK10-like protein [Tanacetum cinerariifolium]